MKKISLFLVLSAVAILSFAQVTPKLKSAAAGWQSIGFADKPPLAFLSLDGYLKQGNDQCLKRVAAQINKFKNNAQFGKINNSIGYKLAKLNPDCKYFRYELSEFTQRFGDDSSTTSPQFTYRCYKTANMGLPSASVAQAPVVRMNTASYDEDNFKNECDALKIAKKLEANLDKELKNGGKQKQESKSETSYSGKEKSVPVKRTKVNN